MEINNNDKVDQFSVDLDLVRRAKLEIKSKSIFRQASNFKINQADVASAIKKSLPLTYRRPNYLQYIDYV